jgi:transposase-like protein
MWMADAIRQIGVTEVTFYRWRKEYGGMKSDQLKPTCPHRAATQCPRITPASA